MCKWRTFFTLFYTCVRCVLGFPGTIWWRLSFPPMIGHSTLQSIGWPYMWVDMGALSSTSLVYKPVFQHSGSLECCKCATLSFLIAFVVHFGLLTLIILMTLWPLWPLLHLALSSLLPLLTMLWLLTSLVSRTASVFPCCKASALAFCKDFPSASRAWA